jgi:pyruvate dehydrogenase E2 component (dihydrolipoamide acetyltransferase)
MSDTGLVDIGMPRLSDSMEEATISAWLKQPGDEFRRGEPLVEVETDKATMVYEAETAGVLEEIVVDDGSAADLGAVIARIRVSGAAEALSGPAQRARRPLAYLRPRLLRHLRACRPPTQRRPWPRSSSATPSARRSTRSSPATSASSSSARTSPSPEAFSQ